MPELVVGVDLSGTWSVDLAQVSATGACGGIAIVDHTAFTFVHDPAAKTFAIVDDGQVVPGTLRGVEAAATLTLGSGPALTTDLKLTFTTDGTGFNGTLQVSNGSCTVVLSTIGRRALQVIDTDPPTAALDVDYDSVIALEFDRPVDATTVANQSVVVTAGSRVLPGSVTVTGTFVVFQPDDLLPVGAEITVEVADDVRAADGRVLGRDFTTTFTTRSVNEDFRYQLESPDGQVALDVLPDFRAELSIPDAADAGQRWRFTDLTSYGVAGAWMLRNDQFVNGRHLEGADGISPSQMNSFAGFSVLPGGTIWFVEPVGELVRIKLLGPERFLMRTSTLPGGFARLGTAADPTIDWRLRALERIVTPFQIVSVNPGEIVQAELSSTDPVGMRPGAFANLYLLTIREPSSLRLTMRSAEPGIDCFLFVCSDDCRNDPDLQNWSTCALAADDDGGASDPEALSTRDARIEITLPAGRFFVLATTFHAQRTGAYELRVAAVVPRMAGGGAEDAAESDVLVPLRPEQLVGATKR